MISVSDTGCGMDRRIQDRIFEPFFTTKQSGKGTGLGLSTVFGIVKQSDGHIEVESCPGRGTTFRIYLPQANPSDGAYSAEKVTADIPAGSESILLVEDDSGVRKMVSKALRSLGYTIYEARTGAEALALFERNHKAIRLLMTDVIMPEMNGYDLARRLVDRKPGTKVLYTSGYLENDTVNKIVLDEKVSFLQKPFTPIDLARKIRESLDG
jgi:CheY-like chemotaxis protein